MSSLLYRLNIQVFIIGISLFNILNIDFFLKFIKGISPYIEIVFGALIAHRFFLKQFLVQREEERISRILGRKEDLNKEIFDKISEKVEDVYLALSWVKNYDHLFLDPQNRKLLVGKFADRCYELQEKLNLLSLSCEKYDFIEDYDHENIKRVFQFASQLGDLQTNIEKNIQKAEEEELIKNLQSLSEVCSKINLGVQKVANSTKKILKNMIDSLDNQLPKR